MIINKLISSKQKTYLSFPLANQVDFLVKLTDCGVQSDHENFANFLPSALRPRMLTAVVKEVLPEDSRDFCLEGRSCHLK